MLECSTSWSIGHHIGIHCNCMCFYRDPNYLQPILNPGSFCPCILAAAQYCFLIKRIWLYCRILNIQDCPKRISPARSVCRCLDHVDWLRLSVNVPPLFLQFRYLLYWNLKFFLFPTRAWGLSPHTVMSGLVHLYTD